MYKRQYGRSSNRIFYLFDIICRVAGMEKNKISIVVPCFNEKEEMCIRDRSAVIFAGATGRESVSCN